MRPDNSRTIAIHYHPNVYRWGISATFVTADLTERRHRQVSLSSAVRLAQVIRDTTYNRDGHVFAYNDGWTWDRRPLP